MNNFSRWSLLFCCCVITSAARAQKVTKYNLSELYKNKNFLIENPTYTVTDTAGKQSVTVAGIVFLKNVDFATGSIDVDIRGKNVFQQSFVGIAFHATDTVTYDCIYFRPFNFQSADSLRRKHTVQYISEPKFPWDKLRAEHPLVYESGVNPVPLSTDWFHAHIVVTNDYITVYVSHSTIPSLKVKKLGSLNNGKIGLWSSGLPGDFANLQIKSEGSTH
jgi:hypothetical protein